MSLFFTTPIVQVLLIPFLGTIVLIGLIRLIDRKSFGISTANSTVGAGFAWVWALILGTPNFPPAFNSGAILSATVCLLGIGMALDLGLKDTTKFGRFIETTAFILSGIGIAAWMRGGIDFWAIPILLCWGVVVFGLQRVGTAREFGSGDGALLLALASIGLGLIAWISDIAIDRDLAFGLSATSLGFLLWNLPKPRLFFGRSILLAGGGGLYMIALRLIEQAPPLLPSLILVGFVFFADGAVRHFPQKFTMSGFLPPSMKLTILALIPLVLALLAAVIATEFPVN